jgi:polar amino acid transport system substrate-binding protein
VAVAALWFFVALFAGGGNARAADNSLAKVRARGVLLWGGDTQGGEPYVYADPNAPSRLIGFEVDLAEAIAKRLGVKQQFVQNDWANLVPSLARGTFDMIMNGLEVTPSRVGALRFSRPYYVFAERLMVRADDTRISGLATVGDRRVGTLNNSFAYELLRGKNVVGYDGVEEPYLDLVARRTDAVLLDDIIATRYGAPKKELRVVGDVAEGYYAIGVRPEDASLGDAIDTALADITKSGELARILTKAHIMSPREDRLSTWSDIDQKKMLSIDQKAMASGDTKAMPIVDQHVADSPPPPAVFGTGHVILFLQGAGMTLLVSTLAMLLAIPLGMFLALARSYLPRKYAIPASIYVEVYRGTPVLLQLYLLYYGIAPLIRLDALTAAVIGLGMNYAAYEAETYRAGFAAVPVGQMEAALSLGMTRNLAIRRILLPQAFRHALPNVTNDFIALLKDSSLVSVLTVVELTKRMTITAVDVRGWAIPGALCAVLYFVMSYPLSMLARWLERKMGGGAAHDRR